MFRINTNMPRVVAVRRLRVERAVNHVEEHQPCRHRDGDRARRTPPPRADDGAAATARAAEHREEDDELRVEPRQHRQQRAANEPAGRCRSSSLALPDPERGPRDDQRARHLREDQPAVRQERHGQATAGHTQSSPRARRRWRTRGRRSPAPSARQADRERHHAAIARRGVRREHQRGEARRMNRVDLPVQAALHVVGTKRRPAQNAW